MGRSKTHEEYVIELSIKNPNLEVMEMYQGIFTPIDHRCKQHNIIWKCRPHNALYGAGCEQCRVDKYREKRARTHDEYINELLIKNPNLEVLENYINIDTKILHKCKKHNYIWKLAPVNALQGYGCKYCKGEKIHNNFARTNEEYISMLKNINPNIISLEEYKNSKTPILHKCTLHGIEWKTAPGCILVGGGCYKCHIEKISKANSLSHEEYIERLSDVNSSIIPLEKYININTKIKHLCTIHNIEWNVSPASTLQGHGCPKCGSEQLGKSLSKTHEEYLSELHKLNIDVEVLEEYAGANTPIAHLCKKHNEIWYPTPSNVLRGNSCGCYKCKSYKGETFIENWLVDNDIKYEIHKPFNDCRDSRVLPFDFYLPDLNKCIEYDGKQHYEPIAYFGGEKSFETQKYHDQIKDTYCRLRNIPLLRIRYDDNNIEEKLKNFLFN